MTSHIINYDKHTNLPNLKVQNNLPFVDIFSIHLDTIDPEGLKQELASLKHRKGKEHQPCDPAAEKTSLGPRAGRGHSASFHCRLTPSVALASGPEHPHL